MVISFTLNANGNVLSAKVARASGTAALDKAALAAVRSASPFPPIPAGLGSTITVSAPIRFDQGR